MTSLPSQIDNPKGNKNNQLTTWPGLTIEAVKKYLPDSCPATDKGHMKRHQKGIISTKEKVKDAFKKIERARCINPLEVRERMNQIFMTLGYVDKKEGTKKLPITSIHGMTDMFIMYDWTPNYIL